MAQDMIPNRTGLGFLLPFYEVFLNLNFHFLDNPAEAVTFAVQKSKVCNAYYTAIS